MVTAVQDLQLGGNSIDLKGKIFLPFWWLYIHWKLDNLYLKKTLRQMYDSERMTEHIIADFLVGLRSPFKDMGCPRWAWYDIERRGIYGLHPDKSEIFLFHKPKRDGSGINHLAVDTCMYQSVAGEISRNERITPERERELNLLIFNHFIRNRFELYFGSFMPLGGEIESPVKMMPSKVKQLKQINKTL